MYYHIQKVHMAKLGDAKALKAEARQLYDQAFKECGLLEAAVGKELDLIPKVLNMRDREEAKLAARRKQLRADNLQTELLAAAIREEAADTVPAGSEAWTNYLVEAAGLYDEIYKKYRSRLARFHLTPFLFPSLHAHVYNMFIFVPVLK